MELEKPLVQVSDKEVRLNFALNTKCRANITLSSLSSTTLVAFKVQTSSPRKFLVNPPTGFVSPSSSTTVQIILKPQTHLPPTFPRSPADSFLIKTAPFTHNHRPDDDDDSLNCWFSSLPHGLVTQSFKLKVAFVGPFLLRHAVTCGDVNSAKNIIKKQRSVLAELPPVEAESLLRVATELAHPENMVNLLLEAGLKIDARVKVDNEVDNKWESKGWSELHVAVAFNRMEEVLNLVQTFVPLDLRDREGRTPLHLAASRGNIRCAKVLVESGADKDARSKDGRTVLYRAAANGDRRMVEMLIEMGADPTIADDRGRSAFDVARDKGHEEIVGILEQGEDVLRAARGGDLKLLESLLRKGANAKYHDQYGLTSLHAAAIKGHKKIVAMLVEIGVDVECQDNEGHSPIHLAVEGGSLETVEVLVNKGANINAKSSQGATPLYLAKAIGYREISEFLINRGASSSSPPPSFHS
ncbi:protein VAPYRIN [Ricinus communis]|uniref:Ankyrin repeat-containing protein, putative n=1 Tax=Ricinus communis TaxID=3988 RepID=B9S453_RICCO|nr:protein VAPYRIN [Ricinus communis]EEF41481.1 ankyrin repeat-containing protein, putative [Ricinus communis]|eukprot:XP_002520772.1 serine/threonine-protein phosphatase 6 regulatory ankyrin repeat subunit B [Ricinus communis]